MVHDNEKLLQKLVEIGAGKNHGANGPAVYKHQRAASYKPTSLNISLRKKENDRIEKENLAFAKRLSYNSN